MIDLPVQAELMEIALNVHFTLQQPSEKARAHAER
jgi:hypothetical protein